MEMDRNVGLDIARISAMCGIIILHILGQGGVLEACDINSTEYWISWWIEICAYCSVDLFALLSGWLGIHKKRHSIFRTFELIMIMLFYSLVITWLFLMLCPDIFAGYSDILYSIFPVLSGRYWYIACYIPIAILQPFINKMILALTINQRKNMCVIAVILFSVFPSLCRVDFFAFKEGYSFAWLLICYVIGAYLKRMEPKRKELNNSFYMFVFFLMGATMLLLGNMLLYTIFKFDWHYLVSYISPIILLMSILLLLYMKNIKLKKGRSVLEKISLVAFDVYIIHCHILIFDFILKDRFIWIVNMNAYFIIIFVFVCSIGLYMGLSLIGMIRIFLFEKMNLNKMLKTISSKIDYIIYKE